MSNKKRAWIIIHAQIRLSHWDSNPDPLKYVISLKVIDLGSKLRITYKQSKVAVERSSLLQHSAISNHCVSYIKRWEVKHSIQIKT